MFKSFPSFKSHFKGQLFSKAFFSLHSREFFFFLILVFTYIILLVDLGHSLFSASIKKILISLTKLLKNYHRFIFSFLPLPLLSSKEKYGRASIGECGREESATATTASLQWWPTSVLVLCEVCYFGIKHKSLTRLTYYGLFIFKYPKVEVESKKLQNIDYLYSPHYQRTST